MSKKKAPPLYDLTITNTRTEEVTRWRGLTEEGVVEHLARQLTRQCSIPPPLAVKFARNAPAVYRFGALSAFTRREARK